MIENPELHLTALYFIQKLRALGEPKMTEELKELNEEMMAHYMRGRYIPRRDGEECGSDPQAERWKSFTADLY